MLDGLMGWLDGEHDQKPMTQHEYEWLHSVGL